MLQCLAKWFHHFAPVVQLTRFLWYCQMMTVSMTTADWFIPTHYCTKQNIDEFCSFIDITIHHKNPSRCINMHARTEPDLHVTPMVYQYTHESNSWLEFDMLCFDWISCTLCTCSILRNNLFCDVKADLLIY